MEERFKAYLLEQFRQIAPTKAAMEYRKSMLVKMLDRAQDLRIKGMSDDELIYNTVILELGDFAGTLRSYEDKNIKKEVGRKVATLGAIASVAWIAVLVIAYLIVGFVAHIWHPTWLIIVGGILLAVTGALAFFAFRFAKKKLFLPMRALTVAIEVLISVTVFLFLQLVGNIAGSWMTFLAMVALIACVDTAIAFLTGSKAKWIELPIGIEILGVMLYVILGVSFSMSGSNIWHPTWLICLIGAVVAMIEGIVAMAKRLNEKKKEEVEQNTKVDESYWTKWD